MMHPNDVPRSLSTVAPVDAATPVLSASDAWSVDPDELSNLGIVVEPLFRPGGDAQWYVAPPAIHVGALFRDYVTRDAELTADFMASPEAGDDDGIYGDDIPAAVAGYMRRKGYQCHERFDVTSNVTDVECDYVVMVFAPVDVDVVEPQWAPVDEGAVVAFVPGWQGDIRRGFDVPVFGWADNAPCGTIYPDPYIVLHPVDVAAMVADDAGQLAWPVGRAGEYRAPGEIGRIAECCELSWSDAVRELGEPVACRMRPEGPFYTFGDGTVLVADVSSY